jgi:hypothetical protein
MIEFEHKLKAYQAREHALVESHKRFTKLQKSMIAGIELYKEAFTDVKLIYNRGEKLRRYVSCENNYVEITEEIKNIN